MGTSQSRGDRHARRPRIASIGGPVRPVFDHDPYSSDKPDYKTQALCKQVRRALVLALAGECGDPVLQSLMIEDVLPAPNAGRLLVRAYARTTNSEPTVAAILQRLDRVHGLLRARIAESIARKRTPEIFFNIIAVDTVPRLTDGEAYDG